MPVVAADGNIDCPVMQQWVKLEALVARAGQGKIALMNKTALDRESVADNHELLIPLVSEFGTLYGLVNANPIQTYTNYSCMSLQ